MIDVRCACRVFPDAVPPAAAASSSSSDAGGSRPRGADSAPTNATTASLSRSTSLTLPEHEPGVSGGADGHHDAVHSEDDSGGGDSDCDGPGGVHGGGVEECAPHGLVDPQGDARPLAAVIGVETQRKKKEVMHDMVELEARVRQTVAICSGLALARRTWLACAEPSHCEDIGRRYRGCACPKGSAGGGTEAGMCAHCNCTML